MCGQLTYLKAGITCLIEHAVAGDRDALGELLQRHTSNLRRVVASRLPDGLRRTIDIDDVVQETFAVAVQHIARFRPQGAAAFQAWLKAIATTRVVQIVRAHLRKKRVGNLRCIDIVAITRGSMVGAFDNVIGDENTPFDDACRSEEMERTRIALARLPADYRRAMQLRIFEELTTTEIAEELGRTYSATLGLIKRSKRQLQFALGPEFGP